MFLPFNSIYTSNYKLQCLAAIALFLCVGILQANPKVFKAVLNEDITIERVYEVHDINFTISEALSNDSFLEDGVISGVAGLDAVTGRLIVEVENLNKSGIAMPAVGYVEGNDKEKGIPACTLWQTRMFEESKLCYAAEVLKGQEFKLVISVEDANLLPPVAEQ